ncbi:aldo/keto reductase [Rhodococcus fascians]|nr:aldo/keto reductase [Rhodococcus fascians]MBY3999964.1 aldo/keto reductase [Rhodococcus fascians]MBY4005147.1 aldo/keto reductase [Rhodococcus fascians]MBY4010294.1 aldo/keto reductase [Rhodococcus fascians]MBY4020337.1 aldo/keto reductase [Rhodococcus fascians]
MDYARLGSSDLRVSRIALGCMSFGDPASGFQKWTQPMTDALPFFEQALDLGITFWDTANVYSYGDSEAIVGEALRRFTKRDEIVVATKVFHKVFDRPGDSGLSRKAIMQQIDASLKRLGTDYVDLYQIHRFDPHTPIEETMEALHDVVKSGKARYLGASSMWAWQFAKLQHAADVGGWTRFVSMQDQYSLLYREEEREMFDLLLDQGVGSIPYSPLAKGRVARPAGQRTRRSTDDPAANSFFSECERDRPIIDAVQTVAETRGVTMAQIAMAWVLRNSVVTAPIVGATRPHHLDDAAMAVDVDLTADEVEALERHYRVRAAGGF